MTIHPVRLGLAVGLTKAVLLIVLGVLAGLFRLGSEWVRVLRSVYIGYDVTIVGIGLGALWGLLAGFAVGWLFAVVFNFFSYLDAGSDYE